MEIEVVNKQEYEKRVEQCKYIYNNVWFHELNKNKVDKIYYLLFKTSKYKFGITAGVMKEVMLFPYSAPFSIFEKLYKDINIENIEELLIELEKFGKQTGVNRIQFCIPPNFYDESYISMLQNCLLRSGYDIKQCDLNYQFRIISKEYLEKTLKRNAKKNLKIAEKLPYRLFHCDNLEMKKKAYNIIQINRSSKGYPLRMSWEQVKNTIKEIEHDFFILKLNDEEIAAAVVFGVTSEIFQVIYWGDIPEKSSNKPMNYLAYHLYLYYLEKNVKILDIGISTENGFPNYGLCSFKESIGCEVSTKYTYVKEL